MNRLSLPQLALLCVVVAAAPVLRAADNGVILSEDFESTPVGQIPAGFTKTGAVKVVDTVAHSGKHSLEIEPAPRGPRYLSLPADQVAALGGEQWGRFYFKVKTPAPSPVPNPAKKMALIHGTFVAGEAMSPLEHDHTQVRLAGFNLNKDGQFHYLYNVQPKGGRAEFGKHSKNLHTFNDEWVLVEWHADYATQSYALYLNGSDTPEVAFSNGAGNFKGAEIPERFQTFSIGFTNYQAASGKGFTMWLDDIAIGKHRLARLRPGSPPELRAMNQPRRDALFGSPSCTGKRRYASQGDALDAAATLGLERVRQAYQCPVCGKWHLTSAAPRRGR